MRKIILSILFCLSALSFFGCTAKSKIRIAETEHIQALSISELVEKKNSGEDFWIYLGYDSNQDCQKLQESLSKYLEDTDKELLYFDTDVADTELTDWFAFLEGYNLEDDIPAAMLHISKGYIVERYDVSDGNAVKKFKAEYSKSNNRADTYINEISVAEFKKMYEAGEEFWIYLGRSSCKDCRKYYPSLIKYLKEVEESIYYVVSDKDLLAEDALAYLTDFRDRYEIAEVPAILHMDKNEMIMHYDMQKEEDIQLFEEDFHECCSMLN